MVQRVYEEGEENLESSDDEGSDDGEDDDEKSFLIDEALRIAYSTTTDDKRIIISWRDLSGEVGDHFEFICDADTKGSLFDLFDLSARRCQYERKFQKPFSAATEADLEAFEYNESEDEEVSAKKVVEDEDSDSGFQSADEGDEVKSHLPASKKKAPITPITPSTPSKAQTAVPRTPAAKLPAVTPVSTPAKAQTPAKIPVQETPVPEDIPEINGVLLFESEVALHLFDPATGAFTEQVSHADLLIYDLGKFEFWLEVDSGAKRFIGTPVSADMNPVFNYEHLSFIFNFFNGALAFSWLLKFSDFAELEKFQEAFMQGLWESTNKTKWIKVKEDERNYLADSFRDLHVDEADIDAIPEEDEEDYEEDEQEHSTGLRQGNAEEDYSDDEDYDEIEKMGGKGKNSQLTVGHKSDRTFVVRDNKLGVFKQTTDNELEFQTTIENITTTKGKAFIPQKLMLHTEERAMIMQDPDNLNSLYRMDLEYGKVVDEWEISDTHKVKAFAPSQKFAQMSDEQTLIGASDNGLFRIDPRLSGQKLVDSQLKSYATKVNFGTLATTEKGHIAVASANGDIRLYDRIGVNAKTHLPAMGDAITGIEVSSDGRWILATCKTYLLLIDSTIKGGKNEGQIGFLKSFSKDSKPMPKRLQISPEHIAHMHVETGTPLNFTTAHFNAGLDSKEQTIVTSSGPYVITWSLKQLLRNDRSPYLIKRYSANVAADNFKFGSDKNVIIALEHDVGMVDRRTFRKPTRESIATPARRIQAMSRNSVVNSPY